MFFSLLYISSTFVRSMASIGCLQIEPVCTDVTKHGLFDHIYSTRGLASFTNLLNAVSSLMLFEFSSSRPEASVWSTGTLNTGLENNFEECSPSVFFDVLFFFSSIFLSSSKRVNIPKSYC